MTLVFSRRSKTHHRVDKNCPPPKRIRFRSMYDYISHDSIGTLEYGRDLPGMKFTKFLLQLIFEI